MSSLRERRYHFSLGLGNMGGGMGSMSMFGGGSFDAGSTGGDTAAEIAGQMGSTNGSNKMAADNTSPWTSFKMNRDAVDIDARKEALKNRGLLDPGKAASAMMQAEAFTSELPDMKLYEFSFPMRV